MKLRTYCYYGHEVNKPCHCPKYEESNCISKKCKYLKTVRRRQDEARRKIEK